jgi:ankyrin repeat protein
VAARADDGWTPLHVAVEQGNADIVRILVEHGADATIQANDGRTPLHMAAETGNVEVLRILVGQDTDTAQSTRTWGRRFVYLISFFVVSVSVGISLYFTRT